MSNEDRKARLKALREAAARKEQGDDATKQDDTSPDKPSTLKFRNYIVKDESIKHEKVRDDCQESLYDSLYWLVAFAFCSELNFNVVLLWYR